MASLPSQKFGILSPYKILQCPHCQVRQHTPRSGDQHKYLWGVITLQSRFTLRFILPSFSDPWFFPVLGCSAFSCGITTSVLLSPLKHFPPAAPNEVPCTSTVCIPVMVHPHPCSVISVFPMILEVDLHCPLSHLFYE
jgi:hypothetical protein